MKEVTLYVVEECWRGGHPVREGWLVCKETAKQFRILQKDPKIQRVYVIIIRKDGEGHPIGDKHISFGRTRDEAFYDFIGRRCKAQARHQKEIEALQTKINEADALYLGGEE